jgi:hypothetical protein
MSQDDLEELYGDGLTEHGWIPIARLGKHSMADIWDLVSDPSVYLFSRLPVISGVVAMPHFHPETRKQTVAFIERLVAEPNGLERHELAGILCECADAGWMELQQLAERLASEMDPLDVGIHAMATADDLRQAFQDGPVSDFISRRKVSVQEIYAEYRRWMEANEGEDDEGPQDPLSSEEEDPIGRHLSARRGLPKVGRNEPCPCGSGKKYKKCHGA